MSFACLVKLFVTLEYTIAFVWFLVSYVAILIILRLVIIHVKVQMSHRLVYHTMLCVHVHRQPGCGVVVVVHMYAL